MAALIIIALVFVVYYRTFFFGLIVDDIRHNQHIKDGFFKVSFVKNLQRRFYGIGTLARNGKTNLIHEHIFSTIIHAIICLLMYYVFGQNLVSFMAAVLYVVNPVNNQTAIWLNGRRYAMNIVIVLSMLALGKWGIILYPLIAFLQVSAFFAPILYGWVGILILPLVLFLAGREIRDKMNYRFDKVVNSQHRKFHFKKAIPIIKIYGNSFVKMIFPGRTMMIYPFLFYWGMTEEGNQ